MKIISLFIGQHIIQQKVVVLKLTEVNEVYNMNE